MSQRNTFKVNADGSMDLYIQNESPGKDKEQNWAAARKDKFILMMRPYGSRARPVVFDELR